MTAAADWKKHKCGVQITNLSGEKFYFDYCGCSTKQSEWDLLGFLDELVAVVQPRQEGDESPLPCEDGSVLLQVIHVQTEKNVRKTFQ